MMSNFSQKDANNLAKLFQETAPTIPDESLRKELSKTSLQLKEASKTAIDINSEIVEDLSYNLDFLLLYSLKSQNPSYIKSVTNLLKDCSSVEGFDIDKNIGDGNESKEGRGLSTEVIISRVMYDFTQAKKSDKDVYYECIKGIMGCSGRNKNKAPLDFALAQGDFNFVAQYQQTRSLKEIKESIKTQKTDENQLYRVAQEFTEQQKTEKISDKSPPYRLQTQQAYQGLAALALLFLLKRQYGKKSSAKTTANDAENIECENSTKTSRRKKKKKPKQSKINSGQKSANTEQEQQTVPSVVVTDNSPELSPLFVPSVAKPIEPTEQFCLNDPQNPITSPAITPEMLEAKTQEIELLKNLLQRSEELTAKAEEETRNVRNYHINSIKNMNKYVDIVERNAATNATKNARKRLEPEKELAYTQGVEHGSVIVQTQYLGLAQQAYNDGVGAGLAMTQEQNIAVLQQAYLDGYSTASAEVQESTYNQGYKEGYFYAVQRYPEDSVKVLKKQLNLTTNTDKSVPSASAANKHLESYLHKKNPESGTSRSSHVDSVSARSSRYSRSNSV